MAQNYDYGSSEWNIPTERKPGFRERLGKAARMAGAIVLHRFGLGPDPLGPQKEYAAYRAHMEELRAKREERQAVNDAFGDLTASVLSPDQYGRVPETRRFSKVLHDGSASGRSVDVGVGWGFIRPESNWKVRPNAAQVRIVTDDPDHKNGVNVQVFYPAAGKTVEVVNYSGTLRFHPDDPKKWQIVHDGNRPRISQATLEQIQDLADLTAPQIPETAPQQPPAPSSTIYTSQSYYDHHPGYARTS